MWQNMLMQMLFGAMVGYITNDFALEMLFEKRFGLGGVIPRTKDQFVDNISELVEKDIITQAVIKEEIEKPEFDRSISKAVRDFFDRSLREKTPAISLAEAPGFETLAENLAAYAEERMDDIVGQLTAVLETHVQFEELAGEHQRRFATEHFFDEMLYVLQNSTALETLTREIAADIKENRLQALLDWILIFVSRNRAELENMIGRAIMGGLSKMGPMLAMLAGGISIAGGPIPAEIVNFLADRERLEKLLNEKLDEVIQGESGLPGEAKKAVVRLLEDERDALLAKAQHTIMHSLEKLTAREVIEALELKAVLRGLARPEILRELAKGLNLRGLYETFISKTQAAQYVKENVSESVSGFVRANAGRLLSGQIKMFVKNNLSRYDENQVKESARSFIGRNLKPITYFGAFLGVLTGFILSFAAPAAASQLGGALAGAGGAGALLSPPGLVMIIIYMAAYGLLGWATNWIAIMMLFRPYHHYKLLPFFSPGYIMKNKPAFAASLGSFIETEVLSGKLIFAWFSGGKATVRLRIQEKIHANQHELIRNALTDGQDRLADYMAGWEAGWLRENKEILADWLTGIVNGLDLGRLVDQNQEQMTAFLYKQIKHESSVQAVQRAAGSMLDKLVQRALEALEDQEKLEKLAAYIYENIPVLSSIPFLSQAMVKQILVQVLDTLFKEEIPGFWASKSHEARTALAGQLDERILGLAAVQAGRVLSGQKAGKYLLDGETRKGIALQLTRMADSETFLQSETRSIGRLLKDITQHATFMLGETLLSYAAAVTADGVTDTIERNIGQVLTSVSFAQITREQVMKLEGHQIHKLFDSFMHKYFISIRRYGFIGAVFGINAVLSLVLILTYWLWQIKGYFSKK